MVVANHPKLAADAGQGAVGGLATASASSNRSDTADDRPFWATVNVCDTKNSPNALGIRTSVPGNGTRQRIFSRYTAQWWSEADQQWLTVEGSGVTPWVLVGSADMASRQAGWTFTFVQPPEGTTYVMRGVVELEWRDSAAASKRSTAPTASTLPASGSAPRGAHIAAATLAVPRATPSCSGARCSRRRA